MWDPFSLLFRREAMAVLASCSQGPVLDHVLPVRLADRRMARRADKVRVYPFELESCIAIVIEPVGGPALGRAVTALTVLLLVLGELAAMHVPMARITGRRRAPVHPRRAGRVADASGRCPR